MVISSPISVNWPLLTHRNVRVCNIFGRRQVCWTIPLDGRTRVLIRRPADIRPSEITSQANYVNRRRFMEGGLLAGASLLSGAALAADLPAGRGAKLDKVMRSEFSTAEEPNSFEDISTYNNYYEFGTGKADPSNNAGDFQPRPWTIEVAGQADKTGSFALEDILRPHALQERIYRMRCVEAWSRSGRVAVDIRSRSQSVGRLAARERTAAYRGGASLFCRTGAPGRIQTRPDIGCPACGGYTAPPKKTPGFFSPKR
jgi:hypothetical protein